MIGYMNGFLSKIKTYKWLLFPLIPLIVFVFITVYLFSAQNPAPNTTPTSPTAPFEEISMSPGVVNTSPTEPPHIDPEDLYVDSYWDSDPSSLQGIQKVEDLPNGTKKYTATSASPARPNIMITKDNITLYQRTIPSPNADIPVQNFTELFGQPDRMVNGPSFYGDTALEYIYAQRGFSIVVDKQTQQVVEQHFFKPTTVDSYIENFGNDGLPLNK